VIELGPGTGALTRALLARGVPLHRLALVEADPQLADALGLGNGATRLFLGADPATRGDVDPRRLAAPGVPVTIVHGDRDETVPIEVGRSYADAHRATKLVAVEGAGHYPPIDPQTPAFAIVLDELGALSRAGP